MRMCQELLDRDSPANLEVFQLTARDAPSCHLYMEAQIFTPDSRRFVLHRGTDVHGHVIRNNPAHEYLLCDVENGCALSPLVTERNAIAPSLSPDGRWLYFFIDDSESPDSRGGIALKRIALAGGPAETLLALPGALPDTAFRPRKLYPLSTISSDGKRLAVQAYLGNHEFGLLVFDLEAATVRLVLHGPTFANMHPQYCRSQDPSAGRDIMIQENHGYPTDEDGHLIMPGESEPGIDIHCVRDDGAVWRDFPWGRDGNERLQGHQCWIGRSTLGITSTLTREPWSRRLIAGEPAPHAGHVGNRTPGGRRNDLSANEEVPRFYHFQPDREGRRLITDRADPKRGWQLYLAELPADPLAGPMSAARYLLTANPREKAKEDIHPFLSPDGTMAFFNSDASGMVQAYMARGF